ncbi:hypothetical protein M569_05409, partial [Genlisea aurea]
APIISSYNDKIRPLLDAVDRLRNLKIMQEGIQLPTIVVVGDQSSGKSSVLESLAGISLPRGQGICTRVPLVMRLQNQPTETPEIYLEFNEKTVPTDEESISADIVAATDELAGDGKGISSAPLTLVVKKMDVPNLTMVDLPGITRVPVHGQPDDIYEQIAKIITEFIKPEESIILNVLSASVDFTTCESIRMSQQVDKTGQRTLAVVTKCDKSPEGLLEKITGDDVKIGLGYVCVRNRIGNESYEEARKEEVSLFANNTMLSKISKSMVGIPVLAEKLMQIQATIIARSFPEIVKKISSKLSSTVDTLRKLPRGVDSLAEAMTSFMHILGSTKESLKKIMLRGEFDEYPNDKNMHCTARFAEMLDRYFEDMKKICSKNYEENTFLMEEMNVLKETRSIGLPNFTSRSAFLSMLQKEISVIDSVPFDFVDSTWKYIETVVLSVITDHCELYPQLLSATRRAAVDLAESKKSTFRQWVRDIIDMEKLADYTCSPHYTNTYSRLLGSEPAFMAAVKDSRVASMVSVYRIGEINVRHLRGTVGVEIVREAFDLHIRVIAYMDVVRMRLADHVALHLVFAINNLVNKELEGEIIKRLLDPHGDGLEKMMEESPAIAEEKKRLKVSIKLLQESKDVVTNIMDK